MNDIDLTNLPVYNINNYRYDHWFEKIQPNGTVMNERDREEFIRMIDSGVALNKRFLDFIISDLNGLGENESEYNRIERVILNAWFFTAQTTADCMVACKYFLLSDTEYDRKYMRGKLKVILNEGIKKLVGFSTKQQKETIWDSISGIMKHFPGSVYQQQYRELTELLNRHSKSSSWWKTTRDAETHLETMNLYLSRQEDLDESRVMLESLELTGALDAVNHFLQNLHAGLTNWLNDQYRQHPEKFKA